MTPKSAAPPNVSTAVDYERNGDDMIISSSKSNNSEIEECVIGDTNNTTSINHSTTYHHHNKDVGNPNHNYTVVSASAKEEEEDHKNINKHNMDDNDGFYYLSSDARKKLVQYQYHGADLSLMYQYILSPLAAFCVNYLTPKTIAPNTITLSGLSLMIISYSIYCYYVPTLEIITSTSPIPEDEVDVDMEEGDEDNQDTSYYPPRWIFFFNGLAMLVYQTLDNMDGKQARRTQSSSPLGLLFDHGCDAVNSMFGSANWIVGMGLLLEQDLLYCWIILFGPFAMFYIATWEEYYTGQLILPLVNGPNEGLFLGAMLSWTSYIYGYMYWQETTWHDTIVVPLVERLLPSHYSEDMVSMVLSSVPQRNCDFIVLAATIGFIQEILMKTWNVTRTYGRAALWDLLPMTNLSIGFFIIGWIQPDIWCTMPRTSLWLASILFSEMCTELMLCHITAQTFNPLYGRWHLIPLLTLAIYIFIFGQGDGSSGGGGDDNNNNTGIQSFLLCYTAGLTVYFIMKIVFVIHEVCTVLNIWCFDIVTQRKRSTTTGESMVIATTTTAKQE